MGKLFAKKQKEMLSCKLCTLCIVLAKDKTKERRAKFLWQENFGGLMNFICPVDNISILKTTTEEPLNSPNIVKTEENGKIVIGWTEELKKQRETFKQETIREAKTLVK